MRKPFKGGRLDDFVSAGEAEARYGPRRYAAVYEDLQNIEVENSERSKIIEKERAYSKRVYDALKKELINDHLFLSFMGCAVMWSLVDLTAVRSYAAGAALGLLYLVLSQRSADSFNASSLEEVKGGPPALIAPILMVLVVAKNPGQIAFFPIFGGFATYLLSLLLQALKPADFGVSPEGVADVSAD